ncbi:unnamed protein product [Boreogadus saida]
MIYPERQHLSSLTFCKGHPTTPNVYAQVFLRRSRISLCTLGAAAAAVGKHCAGAASRLTFITINITIIITQPTGGDELL